MGLTLHSLLWIATTTLLALDLKRRRSTVSTVSAGGPTPRFSAESEINDGDFEKQPNPFGNVSAPPIRDHAEPVLPPASPDIEGEPVEPYQPYGIQDKHLQYDIPAQLSVTTRG
jgi:hypothetical protein